MKTLLSTIFILLLAPCNSQKKITNTAAANYSKIVITYRSSACFGRCPIYTLTINGETKTTTYNGEKFTEKIGIYTKPISDEELKRLVNAFDKANFNSLDDAYLGQIVDFPTKTITYTNNDKTKTIKDRSGAPDELHTIEKILEGIADSDGWKKTTD